MVIQTTGDSSRVFEVAEEVRMKAQASGKFIIHEVPTGAEPEGVAVSEDGSTVYVTSEVADME